MRPCSPPALLPAKVEPAPSIALSPTGYGGRGSRKLLAPSAAPIAAAYAGGVLLSPFALRSGGRAPSRPQGCWGDSYFSGPGPTFTMRASMKVERVWAASPPPMMAGLP